MAIASLTQKRADISALGIGRYFHRTSIQPLQHKGLNIIAGQGNLVKIAPLDLIILTKDQPPLSRKAPQFQINGFYGFQLIIFNLQDQCHLPCFAGKFSKIQRRNMHRCIGHIRINIKPQITCIRIVIQIDFGPCLTAQHNRGIVWKQLLQQTAWRQISAHIQGAALIGVQGKLHRHITHKANPFQRDIIIHNCYDQLTVIQTVNLRNIANGRGCDQTVNPQIIGLQPPVGQH